MLQEINESPTERFRESDGLRNCGRDHRRIADRAESYEMNSPLKEFHQRAGNFQSESGFAGASRPCQGNQPNGRIEQELLNRCEFPLTADQWSPRDGQMRTSSNLLRRAWLRRAF